MRLRLPRTAIAALLACLALAGGGLAVAAAGVRGKGRPRYRTDAVLVSFKPQAPGRARAQAVQRLGLSADPALRNPYFTRLKIDSRALASGASVKEVLAALRRDPTVRIAEPDYLLHSQALPDDPRFDQQWGLRNTGQTGGLPGADVGAAAAWDATTGSNQVVVAVVDSGIDYEHPDLAANILRDEQDRVVGRDFIDDDADPMDDYGHGTHVAGIIGAVGNNGRGVAGVCWSVKLMPVKFLDSRGEGEVSGAIQAIDFAREHGARIMNNSWGGGDYDPLLLEAIQRARDAGILFVAASGNDGTNSDTEPHYPSSYNSESENVVAVAATDASDTLADFSNYGARSVDLAAPGEGILSTYSGGGYMTISGTSMATPHVSGAAALLLSRFPNLTLAQLKARLLGSAARPAALEGRIAAGRLDLPAALEDDAAAPGEPAELTATHRGERALRFTWRASGDDGAVGRATRYDLRLSDAPIDAAGFEAARPVTTARFPGPPGTLESCLAGGLGPDTPYYAGLRAVDNAGNPSGLVTAGPFRTLPSRDVTLLSDGAEGVPKFAGVEPWASSPEKHFRGSRAYSDSPGQSYFSDSDRSLTQIRAVRPNGAIPVLEFALKASLEAGPDYLDVEASFNDGASWHQLRRFTGSIGWRRERVPMPAFREGQLKVRFRLRSDGNVEYGGVWIDDIRLLAVADLTAVLEDTAEGAPHFTGEGSWTTAAERHFSPDNAYADSPGKPYRALDDVSLTQSAAVRTSIGAPSLTFWLSMDLEPGYDLLRVEQSIAGEAWSPLATLSAQDRGRFYDLPLPVGFDEPVRVRFRLLSDESVNLNGVWVDDIRIVGERLTPIGGYGGRLSLPSRVSFDPVKPGARARRELLIRNKSATEELRVRLAPPAKPFRISDDGRWHTLAPRGTLKVGVTFAPAAPGRATTRLRLRSSDPERRSASVTLTGRGDKL